MFLHWAARFHSTTWLSTFPCFLPFQLLPTGKSPRVNITVYNGQPTSDGSVPSMYSFSPAMYPTPSAPTPAFPYAPFCPNPRLSLPAPHLASHPSAAPTPPTPNSFQTPGTSGESSARRQRRRNALIAAKAAAASATPSQTGHRALPGDASPCPAPPPPSGTGAPPRDAGTSASRSLGAPPRPAPSCGQAAPPADEAARTALLADSLLRAHELPAQSNKTNEFLRQQTEVLVAAL